MTQERKFDVDWPHGHVTSNGMKARILCKDRRNSENRPIIVLADEGKYESTVFLRADGYCDYATSYSLHNAPELKTIFYTLFCKIKDASGKDTWTMIYQSKNKEIVFNYQKAFKQETKFVEVEV